MAKLAFCGLGQMGEPMAQRLLEAGHDLVVWNRTPDRARTLVEQGARQAQSPAEAAAAADAVLTMLATPDALEQVVFGNEALAAGMWEGATLIEMSTIGPNLVRAAALRLPAGVEMLDAPVLGSVKQATEGTLKVFVGGPTALFERWRPVLEHLGRPVHFGPLGAGAAMKLVANSTLGALMSALGEALALADALGLDQALVLDALSESPIGATAKSKRDKIETGDYPPNFKLALAVKDLRLVTEAAAEAGLDLPVAAAARSWMEAAADAGLGDLDYSAVVQRVRGHCTNG
ncbi:MAG: NAD(P)-dependent oxidoreductase [Actinomycetota bacterium]|nr:NAD(P)-dependent oxidoreductase [Actinomycetota bacterium]